MATTGPANRRGRLGDQLSAWLERAELLARGAERQRVDAVTALRAGRPWEARQAARALLTEMPGSRTGLLLWADAAEAMGLDVEVCEALTELAEAVPFRADVWVRLARALHRQGDEVRAALQKAVEAGEPRSASDEACLWLSDLDLLGGDPVRAERWLERVSLGERRAAAVIVRRVEALLDRGEADSAAQLHSELDEPELLDSRGWLLAARVGEHQRKHEEAALAYSRALLLEAPRAGAFAARFVAGCDDPDTVSSFRELVGSAGWSDHPGWRAAFAQADGRPEDALEALSQALRGAAEPSLAQSYMQAALDAQSASHLRRAIDRLRELELEPPAAVSGLAEALVETDPVRRLDALDGASDLEPAVARWASQERARIARDWVPQLGVGLVSWTPVLATWASTAQRLGDLESLRAAELIARELERPLRVAIVGEFNAGKSTFVNALLGEEVAPTGVLPTTATSHRLVWSPDRYARVELEAGPDRVVPHDELRALLKALEKTSDAPAPVRAVTIAAPLERLRALELIDTPGFNAPNANHAARARAVLDELHAAIWLLDAGQPLKESERRVLEEIVQLGLPVLVLLNKRDRLSSEQLETALEHVRKGLEGAGLAPEAPVVACSAKLALKERQGVQQEGASGWPEVERALDSALLGQGPQLRDRVLRRRAGLALKSLGARARQVGATRRASALAQQSELEACRSGLAAAPKDLEERLLERLGPANSALRDDLRPLAGASSGPESQRFAARRSRDRLPTALCAVLEEELEVSWPAGARHQLQGRVAAMASLLGGEFLGDDAPAGGALERLVTQFVYEAEDVLQSLRPAEQMGESRGAALEELEKALLAGLSSHG